MEALARLAQRVARVLSPGDPGVGQRAARLPGAHPQEVIVGCDFRDGGKGTRDASRRAAGRFRRFGLPGEARAHSVAAACAWGMQAYPASTAARARTRGIPPRRERT